MNRVAHFRRTALLAVPRFCFFLLLPVCVSTARALQAAPPAKPEAATYVGVETCQLCHEDIVQAFEKSRHQVVNQDKHRGWEGKACEACHGPGSKHAESADANDIRQPAKLKPGDADKVCMGCHVNQPTHVGRIFGPHAKNQVACVACHSVHKQEPVTVSGRAARINNQCAACHTSERLAFQRPHSHPLQTGGTRPGAMACTDCHNPHGTPLTASLRLSPPGEPGCLNCHGDKRGPFTYEHAPVRLEGCQTCHEPHGTANPRMLTRPQVAQLCLECHANIPVGAPAGAPLGVIPPALHDLRNPRFQNCTVCHMKVHGSHVSKDLFR